MSHHDKVIDSVYRLLVTNGGADGTITVADTTGFYTNQECNLSGNGSVTNLVVLDILSDTVLRMGVRIPGVVPGQPSRIQSGASLTSFTVAGGANVYAPSQTKPNLDAGSVEYYSFESDPVSARRVFGVNSQGNPGIASSAAVFQFAVISNASLTSGNSTITSGFPIMTFINNLKNLLVFNSFNQTVGLLLNNVEIFRLENGDEFVLDFNALGLHIPATYQLSVYQLGTPPTTGTMRITAIE